MADNISTEKISADFLYTNLQYGLERVFSVINPIGVGGITPADIANAYSKLSSTDMPFAQYLAQNISEFDKDSNSEISRNELMTEISKMGNEGLTYNQLLAIQQNSGTTGLADANNALSKLIEHFSEIDKNGDGKITKSEIKAYNLNLEVTEKEKEYKNFTANTISIFYGDSSADTTVDSSADI